MHPISVVLVLAGAVLLLAVETGHGATVTTTAAPDAGGAAGQATEAPVSSNGGVLTVAGHGSSGNAGRADEPAEERKYIEKMAKESCEKASQETIPPGDVRYFALVGVKKYYYICKGPKALRVECTPHILDKICKDISRSTP
ncbi:uncharacterized protein LOC135397628 [Ornithodoros turicata]|uniref:uncharacterized protein LOC135397628 n=1 Tax=Ornithodoros turicata TaxID=34597 RepID=UPI0031386176